MKKDKSTFSESEEKEKNIREKIERYLTFIQKNAGGLTLIATAGVAIGSVLIKLVFYLIEYGKTKYFGVPSSLIDVSGDSVFYDFLVKGIFALFMVLINYIPFSVWNSQTRIWGKLRKTMIMLIIPNVFWLPAVLKDTAGGINYSLEEICMFVFLSALAGGMIFSPGVIWAVMLKRQKQKIEKKKKKKTSFSKKITASLVVISVVLVVESGFLIFSGYNAASNQNQFKIITKDDFSYAVIYENSEKYIITECVIDNGKIAFTDRNTQQEIEKEGVEYTICHVRQLKEN